VDAIPRVLRAVGAYETMASTLPPPFELPESDDTPPDQLVVFLKLLLRDYIPAGFVQQMAAEAYSQKFTARIDDELGALAERIARQLTYQEPEAGVHSPPEAASSNEEVHNG
jgi:hypothetical protein